MDNETMLPMDWKPLREAAEGMAPVLFDALVVAPGVKWADRPESELFIQIRAAHVNAHALLLADLRRPASRDFWARWLAEKVGLTVGATAPEWHRVFPHWWEIRAAYSQEKQWAMVFCPPEDHDSDPPALRGHKIAVAGIDTLTDPAAALRAALLAVVPA